MQVKVLPCSEWRNIPQCVTDCCKDLQDRLKIQELTLKTLRDDTKDALLTMKTIRA